MAGAWLLLAAGLVTAFGHNFVEMWARWFPAWRHGDWSFYDRIVEGESYYTHGPLVLLVSLLIAVLLIRHTKIRVRPRPVLGSVGLVLCLLFHLTACLARVNFASGFAFVGVLASLVLLLWGASALRRLWFPIAMLLFMVPLPAVSIAQLNFHLKMLASDWAVRLVNLLGVVADRSGNRVFLTGDKSLVIANVCNGLRTLISLLAFGALYAYVCRLRGAWRLGLFAMAVPVAVVSNSVRVVSLIVVAEVWDVETATGWYHDTSGMLIFVVAFLLMFAVERLVLWLRRRLGRPATVIPLFHGVRRGVDDPPPWPRMLAAVLGRVGVIACVMVSLSAAGAWWLNRSVPPNWNRQMAAGALPAELNIDGRRWYSYDMTIDDRTLTILETTDYLMRRYVSAGVTPVDFCVIFSRDNRKGTHPPDLCLQGSGEGIVAKGEVLVPVEGLGEISCRELVVQSPRGQHYFLYTYKCGESYTGSFWRQQFTIFANGLVNRDASGALIRVSTTVDAGVDESRQRSIRFLRAAIPYLDRALK